MQSLAKCRKTYAVEPRSPRSTDTHLIRTPGYYGQFRLSRRKAHIFSLKLTRFIRTPVNTDNGHFSVSQVTNSRTLSTPLYGHFLCALSIFNLSKGLSYIQFHLAESQTRSVSTPHTTARSFYTFKYFICSSIFRQVSDFSLHSPDSEDCSHWLLVHNTVPALRN